VKRSRERPLKVPYGYVWFDAIEVKCREEVRTVNVACLVAVGVNNDDHVEVLGLEVVSSEDGAEWLALLRSSALAG